MPITTFYPTWIATYDMTTGRLHKIGEPVIAENQYYTFVGFDYDEMLKACREAEGTVTVNLKYYTDNQAANYCNLAFHEIETPGYLIPSTNYEKVRAIQTTTPGNQSINISSYLTGKTFGDYLAEGYKGIAIIEGNFTAENFHIAIEGTWYPYSPTILYPLGGINLDRAKKITLIWRHESDYVQHSYQLRYRKKDTLVWTTITKISSDGIHSFEPNELEQGEYEWQVRTANESDHFGPWSELGIFNATEATNAPIITSPQPGEIMPTFDLELTWESVENQTAYEIEVEYQLETGVFPIKHSFNGTGSDNSVFIPQVLVFNDQDYTIRLRVLSEGLFWSDWSEINVRTSYTIPAKPILTINPDDEGACLVIDIENPQPSGTEPEVVSQELYRKESDGKWIKLAELGKNESFKDCTVASEQLYEYRVTAIGDNRTSVTSDIFNGMLKLDFSVISVANDLSKYIILEKVRERSITSDFNAHVKKFSGRRLPTTEFGYTFENNISIECYVHGNDYEFLMNLLRNQETSLYRDARGRKIFATISTVTVTDESNNYYSIQLTFTEVDYDEGAESD